MFWPILAIMNICLQNDWKDFGNTVDLFRHEILHGLGFGTLNVIEEHKKSPARDETYIWNTQNGPRKAARAYMDYSKAAVVRWFLCICCEIIWKLASSSTTLWVQQHSWGWGRKRCQNSSEWIHFWSKLSTVWTHIFGHNLFRMNWWLRSCLDSITSLRFLQRFSSRHSLETCKLLDSVLCTCTEL